MLEFSPKGQVKENMTKVEAIAMVLENIEEAHVCLSKQERKTRSFSFFLPDPYQRSQQERGSNCGSS